MTKEDWNDKEDWRLTDSNVLRLIPAPVGVTAPTGEGGKMNQNQKPKTAHGPKKENAMKTIIMTVLVAVIVALAGGNAEAACNKQKVAKNAFASKMLAKAKACKDVAKVRKAYDDLLDELDDAGCAAEDYGLPEEAKDLCKGKAKAPKAKATPKRKPAKTTKSGAMPFNPHAAPLVPLIKARRDVDRMRKFFLWVIANKLPEAKKAMKDASEADVVFAAFSSAAKFCGTFDKTYGDLGTFWVHSTTDTLNKMGCRMLKAKAPLAAAKSVRDLDAELKKLTANQKPIQGELTTNKAKLADVDGKIQKIKTAHAEILRIKPRRKRRQALRKFNLKAKRIELKFLTEKQQALQKVKTKLEQKLALAVKAFTHKKADRDKADKALTAEAAKVRWSCKKNADQKLLKTFLDYAKGKHVSKDEYALMKRYLDEASDSKTDPRMRVLLVWAAMHQLPQSKIAYLTRPTHLNDRLGTMKPGCKEGDFCRAQTSKGLHYGRRKGDQLIGTDGSLTLTPNTDLVGVTLLGRLSGRKWLANLRIELGYSVLGSLTQDDHLTGVSLHMIRAGLANRFNLGSRLFLTPFVHGGFAFVNGDSIARSNLGGDTSSGDRFRGVLALGAKFGVKLSRSWALYGVGEFLAFPGLGGSGGLGVDIDVSSGIRLSADLRWTSIPDTGVSSGKRPDLSLENIGANGLMGNLALSF